MATHLCGMDTEQLELRGLDPLMSVDELAEYLGVPVRTVYDWRTTGHGPRGIRIGRHLYERDIRTLALLAFELYALRVNRPDRYYRANVLSVIHEVMVRASGQTSVPP